MFSDSKYLLPNRAQIQRSCPKKGTKVFGLPGFAGLACVFGWFYGSGKEVPTTLRSNCLKNGRRTLKFTKCIYYGTKTTAASQKVMPT